MGRAVQRVGLLHEHTCRTQHTFHRLVCFVVEADWRAVFFLWSLTWAHQSTWGRRCLGRSGCFSAPGGSGGLCPSGKAQGHE